LPVHIIQRGNNRQPCFFAEDDYRFFLDHLGKLANRFHCSLHAYVLMTNHFHLLLSSELPNGPSLLMKFLGQRYVQYVNPDCAPGHCAKALKRRSLAMSNDLIRLARAYEFAARWHTDQKRKGIKAEPYINHLAEVALLVSESTDGADANLVLSAILHDTIEDTKATFNDLVSAFGQDVAELVKEVTDDKTIPKAQRKRLQVEHAPQLSRRARMIKIADKTSNLRSMLHSPPADWPHERRQRYFAWAKAVVAGARGVNPAIEAAFDAEYEHAIAKGIADRNLVWHPGLEIEGDD
jgi:guanosine-3',5'-bis(diphosphate) 3'-pyrophosphohydrolase